jgi:parallel beta-helix repeat protein
MATPAACAVRPASGPCKIGSALTKRGRASAVGVVLAGLCGSAGCVGGNYSLGYDCLPAGTDKELQAAINAQLEVQLCPGALFKLSAPVLLHAGSTLVTYQRPTDPAQMATLQLAEGFTGQNVGVATVGVNGVLPDNVTIASIRFDGNRRMLGPKSMIQLVYVGPGKNYHIVGNVFKDTPGWAHLHVIEPCDSAIVTGNTVETGSLTHDANLGFADGLAISCSHSTIADNIINNISGTGIVYFGGPGTQIRHNTIVESTTSASSGINVGDAVILDHTGVVISDNIIKAMPPSYFQIGIAAGLRIWPKAIKKDVTGVTVSGNIIIGMNHYGLTVDGCLGCTIQDNQVDNWQALATQAPCPPSAPYVASVTAGHASGSLQSGWVDANLDDCVGPPISP